MATSQNKLKVTLIMVMSVNGIVAQKPIENSFEWNSEADRIQFLEKVRDIGSVIMGANTYRSIGGKPYKGVSFNVLTNHPDRFEAQEGVRFRSGNIATIHSGLKNEGVETIALLGGPTTNRQFLEANLVDDIYLTLEPTLLPGNLRIVENLSLSCPLQLNGIKTLNEQKTLLLHYTVLKPSDPP